MNIELSAKEHIKTLQRHIKANIVADIGGRASANPLAHPLSCSRDLVALYRKLCRFHPVPLLCEGKEGEAHCCGESLRKWSFSRSYDEQRAVVANWCLCRAFPV
jgi:hypothetical protein